MKTIRLTKYYFLLTLLTSLFCTTNSFALDESTNQSGLIREKVGEFYFYYMAYPATEALKNSADLAEVILEEELEEPEKSSSHTASKRRLKKNRNAAVSKKIQSFCADKADKSLEKIKKRREDNRLAAALYRAGNKAFEEILFEEDITIPNATDDTAEILKATEQLKSMPRGQRKTKNCIHARINRAKSALSLEACRKVLRRQPDEKKSELERKIAERKEKLYLKYLADHSNSATDMPSE